MYWAMLAGQTIGLTGSANAWMALAAVMAVAITLIGVGIKVVSNFSRLTESVERLNRNIETITSQVGGHEHRISMLEGRSYPPEIPAPAAVIYPVQKLLSPNTIST